MHAFLLLGSETDVSLKIIELEKRFSAKTLEFTLQKIDDVREVNSFTKLKLTGKTIILIKNFDRASIEAQNAFLKSLEEPQENLFYILTGRYKQNILETIISRCEVFEIINTEFQISKEKKDKTNEFIDSNIGKRLGIIAKINKRDEAIEFIDNLIMVGHEKIITKSNFDIQILENALILKKNLEANGNVQLQLTNFVVNSRI